MEQDETDGYSEAIEDVATDAEGNVATAGVEGNIVIGLDIAVRKYDAAGSELWATSYNYEDDEDDHGWAVAIDHLGFVIVGGQVEDTVTYYNGWIGKFAP